MKSVMVSLTTNELATVLALCGYETMASQILNSMGLEENSVVFDRFIEDTELSLTSKGLKDNSRDSMIVTELEELIHTLVQSKRKVRCIRKNRILFIHFIEGEERTLFQEIRNNNHVFSFESNSNGFESKLLKHFELNEEITNPDINVPTLQLSEEIYNQLHQMDSEILESMINDKQLAEPLKQFLTDFRFNLQEFDNLSLIEMDYVNDYFNVKQVLFLLRSESLVWHLDYENIHQKEVYVVPYDSKIYSNKLNEEISLFFYEEKD
ncbi:hypothetical protein [Terribacillus saccharophilus]|uniref:hypothetical protein n=1 Tax=Terribacillus saccharophilus TaxID=361277 RepID=UPI002989FC74|nr:hypothetical protein [Terribacillus saccharophilus]MCM3226124.1 hypothetical protein [Terribacillus saccharophilus]